MSTNLARTPLAARTRIDPSFSDGYDSDNLGALGGQNMSLAELRSPIEQMARTPQHIRFAEAEPDQPAITIVSRTTNDCEMQLRQTVSMQLMEEQIRRLQDEIQEIRKISSEKEFSTCQSGNKTEVRMLSSEQIAQKEKSRTAPVDMSSQHLNEASSSITSVDTINAPPTVTADRRVKISKYCSIVPTSMEIAKKYSLSSKDKDFDNLDMLDKALRASNLLSLVDGSRIKPTITNLNISGYSAEAIIQTIEADGKSSYIIIDEDDCYKFYAESVVAFTFMTSMIKKDMHHLLVEAMRKEDPIRMYQEIQDHFKGCKLHHVEAARRALEAHRFGPEIEQDLSRLMELIAILEKAQKMPLPESQKFGILKIIMAHEERPHVRAVYGMASYNKESFNATIKKIKEEWDTIPLEKAEGRMAASIAPSPTDRICFKFQTGECSRPQCPFIHKIMSAAEKKEQNYVAKPPGRKENFISKPKKSYASDKKFKGKSDTRNNNSKGTNGMHNNMPLTKEHQMELGKGEIKPTPSNPRGYSKRQIIRGTKLETLMMMEISAVGEESQNPIRIMKMLHTRKICHSICSSHR